MSEWIDFEQWHQCLTMERPGIIFEVKNEEGLRLFTPCIVPLVVPFDWESPPCAFRVVPEPPPRHSTPLPKPPEYP
jgi:hypothetical protein